MKRNHKLFRKWNHFTKDEIQSWEPQHKKCRGCNKVKKFSEFHKGSSAQLFSLSSDCKICRSMESKDNWDFNINNNIEVVIYNRAKSRAKKRGLEFSIDISDIKIPKICPIFNKPLEVRDRDWAPSIDRINPKLGYIKGNVVIVSNRANVIKNNATPEEILTVGNFYKNLQSLT
jgi:hypothetical protein